MAGRCCLKIKLPGVEVVIFLERLIIRNATLALPKIGYVVESVVGDAAAGARAVARSGSG